MEQAVLQTHEQGHLGIIKLYLQLKQQYFSPGLRQIVEKVVKSCPNCQKVKQLDSRNEKPIEMTQLPEPYACYGLDIKGPWSSEKAPFQYLLVVKEMWSGYVTLIPLQDTTSETIAKALYSDIILRFGHFQQLVSDNAPNLSKASMEQICRLLTIKTKKSYVYQSRTNGKVECVMRVINEALRKMVDTETDWFHVVKVIQSSINASPQPHTSFSPFFLQHFREYPSVFAFTESTENDPTNDAHYHSDVVDRVMRDRQVSIDILKSLHDKYRHTQESTKNKGKRAIPLALHQPVYLKIFHPDPTLSEKLQPRWKGPFYVAEFIGNSGVKLTKQVGEAPMQTIIHRDFVKPFVDRLVNPKEGPILKPEQIETKDWLTMDIIPDRHPDIEKDRAKACQNNQAHSNQALSNEAASNLESVQQANDPPTESNDVINPAEGNKHNPQQEKDNYSSLSHNKNNQNTLSDQVISVYGPLPVGRKYNGKDLYLKYVDGDSQLWVRLETLPANHPHRKHLMSIPFITRAARTTRPVT